MKKIVFVIMAVMISMHVFSQRHIRGEYTRDIFGNLQFVRADEFKASLSKNIFDDIVYEDSYKNKLTYKKKFLERLPDQEDWVILNELLRYFADKTNLTEEFEIDIFDKIQYKNNEGFSATFGKNIFDDVEYKDSNKNEIVYKQKFLDLFHLQDLKALDIYLFMDIFYFMMNESNYKEEYAVDIFDRVKYTNNEGAKLEIDSESALRMYNHQKKYKRRNNLWRDFF